MENTGIDNTILITEFDKGIKVMGSCSKMFRLYAVVALCELLDREVVIEFMESYLKTAKDELNNANDTKHIH